ncbi:phospholipid-transporting ATPase ABCA1-like isoform X3 [Biomphalaria glabrata]|uniref:Phospholipid-transporting ATPase ABCA1-like isoform X3 n=1 Tax=Biomphalaria glabrata TaxID=6526 RepID=A0A9W3AAE4_BIOGL|nr:phospholipid-transporting ATPase ABCA1-like isoform X3 [Biomphalaria glabrata]
MGFLLQLRLLLWKNFVLRKRQPFRVVVEIVWPLTLFLILVAVRFRPDVRENIPTCHYAPKAMPSAGTLSFLASYLCDFNNDCNEKSVETDRFAFINNVNGSLLGRLINDLEIILANNSDLNLISNLGQDLQLFNQLIKALSNGSADLTQMRLRLGNILINEQELRDNIVNLSLPLTPKAVDTLLNATLNFSKVSEAFRDSNRTRLDNLITIISDLSMLGNNTRVNTSLVSSIMNTACNDQIVLEYFNFKNPDDGKDLKTQLCNLSLTNATALLEAINKDLNRTELRNEIQNVFRDLTGNVPNLNITNISTLLRVYNDVTQLSSLSNIVADVSDIVSTLSNSSSNGNQSLQTVLGRLICGGDSLLFNMSSDNEQFLQKQENRQEDRNKVRNEEYERAKKANEDAGLTPECAALYANFELQKATRILWRQMKPIILGYINYTPDTPATRKIIKEASRMFDSIISFMNFTIDLQTILPMVETFLKNDFEPVRDFLKGSNCKNTVYFLKNLSGLSANLVPAGLPVGLIRSLNESWCDRAAQFLSVDGFSGSYDWTDALNNTSTLLKNVTSYFKCVQLNKFVGFHDSAAMVEASLQMIQNNTFWSAVVFDNFEAGSTNVPSLVKYRIRMDTDKVDSTKRIMDKYWRPGSRAYINSLKYWIYGFIYIQDMIDHAIIRLHTNTTQEPGILTQQFPYGCYVYDKFVFAISRSLPLFMVISWIYTVAMIIKGIVYEKEQRLKEVMKIMGLGNGIHWLAWFINSFVMMLITVILFVIVLKGGKILEYSDPSVVFVFMLGFTVSTISQCFLISVFFSKANLAAVCGGFIYFVLYLPYTQLVQFEDVITTSERILASLSSNIAMGYACSYFSQYEEQAIGAQWYNIGESPMVDDTFSLRTCIGMMFLDSIIYLIITWYIEAVFPGQYGIPRKWYFIVQKSYWCGFSQKNNAHRVDAEMSIDDITNHSDNFEKDPTDRAVGVAVKNLRKIYKKGDKVAVDGLTLNFYEGQITSFLGHNGAGKTTTMSILTGLFPPTSGTAYIYGRDILTDMDEIRHGLGMCPQHNVLFDLLTVEEHIWFYARLKGRSAEDVNKEIDEMIRDVGLPHKRKEKAENLSGGMKRKLSVAIAFVGGSRTVILDEPTAGVDPYARRAIWELLLKFRKGRTIILSTHHMDEADVLGDRIAIISQGKLCTVGTSLFLKNKFGSGYYLTLVRQEPNGSITDDSASLSSRPLTASSIRTLIEVELMAIRWFWSSIVGTIFDLHKKSALTGSNDGKMQPSGNNVNKFAPTGRSIDKLTSSRIYVPKVSSTKSNIYKMVSAGRNLKSAFTKSKTFAPAFTDEDEGYDEKNTVDSNSDDGVVPLPLPKTRTMVSGFSLPRLTSFIQKIVPGAVLVEDNSMEVCYRLPENDGHARRFQDLFSALETSYKTLGISSYGISDTSLEEVFLKVAEENSPDNETETLQSKLKDDTGRYPTRSPRHSLRGNQTSLFKLSYKNRVNSSEHLTADTDDADSVTSENPDPAVEVNFSGAGKVQVTGRKLVARQMMAMFLKRFHHVRRSKKGFISEILLPAGFVCLAMVFSLILPPFSEEPALELQPWMYEPTKGDNFLYMFYSNENSSNPLAHDLEHNLLHEPFYGTRCMNKSVYEIDGKSCLAPFPLTWTPGKNPEHTKPPECSCSSGFLRCPEGAAGSEPAKMNLWTNDRLYNATGKDLSDWLLKTDSLYQKRRYGGYSFSEKSSISRLDANQISASLDRLIRAANNNKSIFSGAIPLMKDLENGLKFALSPYNLKVWFNNKGWTASVSYMNALNNLLLRTLLPSDKSSQNYGIVTINHPMNLTKEQLNEETLFNSAVNVVVAICVIFAMSFVPASFVLFLIEERVSNSKHLQFVSGINPTVYWLANWSWDMINYSIPALLCILIFVAFGKSAYVSPSNLPCLFALLFLYGWAITPMMYPFSRLFDVPSSAFVALSCVNVFLGTVSTLATFILEVLSQDDPDLKDINDILKQVFLLLPHYCLGRGLIDMASYQTQADLTARFGEVLHYNLFDWKIVGRNLFSMVLLGVLFNLLNWLIEYKFFLSWSCLSKTAVSKLKTEDIDVANEKRRVLSGGAKNDVMRLEGLTKVYWTPGKKGKMTAVDNLYVGVPKGQCFGLLGVNGAGKTTTFKMLTGDVSVTSGDAFINSYSIGKDKVTVRKYMGYCPQFDALDPLLTGREHLEFYARIRGISSKDVKNVADWAIKRLGLVRYCDKISSSYSGGNKRKLSTAIALIGNPPIIFLDEPTTGMDPGARRFLWNCINTIVKSGHSVILTSHSMEECEALCNRLAIMVNGSFQCLGSVQHLKNRFGNGYTIILRVSGQNPDMHPIMEFISSTFPTAKLREKHHNMLQYQLPTDNLSLSRLFEAMELAKRDFHVEDYSVSQTTLDQVFINFAKKQTDLLDEELEDTLQDIEETNVNENNDGDNTSAMYSVDSTSTGLPTEYDEVSVTGSTVDLIRLDSSRSRNRRMGHEQRPKEISDETNTEDTFVSIRL